MSAQAQVLPINESVAESALEAKCLTLYEQATALTICDQKTYAAAGEVGKALKALEKEITDYFEPLRVAAKANYDAVLDKKNSELAPVKEALDIVKSTMNTYAREQDRIRIEAERKAQAEAEELARKEREKLMAQAEKAIDKGKDEKAEELIDRAEAVYPAPVTIAPVIYKTVHTASGNITQAKEIRISVIDMVAFVKELCASNPGAISSILKIGDGPLKSFIKANGIEKYSGLRIERTVGIRL